MRRSPNVGDEVGRFGGATTVGAVSEVLQVAKRSAAGRVAPTLVFLLGVAACSQRSVVGDPGERPKADAGNEGGARSWGDADVVGSTVGPSNAEFDATVDADAALDAGVVDAGSGSEADAAPSGLVCGDGIRVASEGCDPGDAAAELVPCSTHCRPKEIDVTVTHDGDSWGPHALAVAKERGALVVTTRAADGYDVVLLILDRNAAEVARVSLDRVVNGVIEPEVAIGPDGEVAAAWAAAPEAGGGSEIRLALVRDGEVVERQVLGTYGPRRNVDVLGVGNELVAAWGEGFSDVYVQVFDWALSAKSGPARVSAGEELADAPTLVAHENAWAVAWRQSDIYGERLGFADLGKHAVSPPFVPGVEGERLAAFSAAGAVSVVHTVSSDLLGGAVVAVTDFRFMGDEVLAEGPNPVAGTEGAHAPMAARSLGRNFLAWQQRSGENQGDETWWGELEGNRVNGRARFPLTSALGARVLPVLAGSESGLGVAWNVWDGDRGKVGRTHWPLPWDGASGAYPLGSSGWSQSELGEK